MGVVASAQVTSRCTGDIAVNGDGFLCYFLNASSRGKLRQVIVLLKALNLFRFISRGSSRV